MTIPDLSEDVIRLAALQMANEYSEDPQAAMAIADSFVEYITEGSGDVRIICDPALQCTFVEKD